VARDPAEHLAPGALRRQPRRSRGAPDPRRRRAAAGGGRRCSQER
jgi:hypothetical protein